MTIPNIEPDARAPIIEEIARKFRRDPACAYWHTLLIQHSKDPAKEREVMLKIIDDPSGVDFLATCVHVVASLASLTEGEKVEAIDADTPEVLVESIVKHLVEQCRLKGLDLSNDAMAMDRVRAAAAAAADKLEHKEYTTIMLPFIDGEQHLHVRIAGPVMKGGRL